MYWKFVTELFCNKGLISDLILLGEADAEHFLPEKKLIIFSYKQICLTRKLVCQEFLPHNSETSKHITGSE
jgi:hypothetical protein